jgi:hypothetical protein
VPRAPVRALSVIAAFPIGFAGYVWALHWFGLSRSLDELLLSRLGVSYEVERAELAWFGHSQPHGTWQIRVDGDSASVSEALARAGFGAGDRTDLISFEQRVTRDLELGGELDGYRLYQAALGLSSLLCDDQSRCDVAVLVKDGEPDVYVAISSL